MLHLIGIAGGREKRGRNDYLASTAEAVLTTKKVWVGRS